MDRREFHALIDEMIHYSQDVHPPARPVQRRRVINNHDNTKRFATYFPSKVSFNTKWNFADDDESTWEFSAPVARSSRSSSCGTNDTAFSSPAQEIVIRYRAGMPLNSVESPLSSASDTSPGDTWKTTLLDGASISFGYTPAAEKDLKAVYRQSQLDALENSREEAMAAMKTHGLGENDYLVCHRPGCRDTLRDVKALTYHLQIHNIHDQTTQCPTCQKRHEDRRCSKRSSLLKSPPTSPLRESFLRII